MTGRKADSGARRHSEKTIPDKHVYDIFIIGGGVNGCGMARDAAGRGFRVGLAEMNDLASGTSSASTKLIHGGLRYLEYYAFHLVREALQEREVLWRIAPHIIRPLRFLLPMRKGMRPAWLLRTGLFLYDHLGGRKDLPGTKCVNFSGEYGANLKNIGKRGFEYSDARVDDSRLVILNARHAAELGADIMVSAKVLSLKAEGDVWRITLHNSRENKERTVRAHFVANMSGPWINHVMHSAIGLTDNPVRLVQGSHIIVPALYRHDKAYIFQEQDGRVVFTIPYHREYTLIGTTDLDYRGDPAKTHITAEETEYLCKAASAYFKHPIKEDHIIHSYSGVRPLYDDGASSAQSATRDYVLKMVNPADSPPLLNVYGGKITTYRRLAEDAMVYVEKALGARKSAWTKTVPLPGGDFPHRGVAILEESAARLLPQMDKEGIARLVAAYGTDVLRIFEHGKKPLGKHFGHGFYEAELLWLIKEEWARTAEDILWRRTKLGLKFTAEQRAELEAWLAAYKEENSES